MPPDRFDDVEFRILDDPEPRPPRRRRRWLVAGGGAVLAAGALAAGASALTDSGNDPAPAAKPPAREAGSHHRFGHDGCHHGEGRASPDSSTLKY
jgi:hypothetical protein